MVVSSCPGLDQPLSTGTTREVMISILTRSTHARVWFPLVLPSQASFESYFRASVRLSRVRRERIVFVFPDYDIRWMARHFQFLQSFSKLSGPLLIHIRLPGSFTFIQNEAQRHHSAVLCLPRLCTKSVPLSLHDRNEFY